MGIPLAALASQPQPTPFQQTGQLLGIQGAQQEQQLRQQQIQGATLQNQLQEQQLKDSQIFADSLRSNKGNLDAALEDAAQKGMSGQGYLQHGQQILQMKVAQQKLSSEQLDLQNKVFDKIDGQLQSYKALSPEDQQSQWPQYRQQVISAAPQLANALPQNAPTSQQIDAFEPQLMGGKWATAREQKNRELAAQEQTASARALQATTSASEFQAKLNGPLNPVTLAGQEAQKRLDVESSPQAIKAAAQKSSAEAAAKLPFELAGAKAKQAITQGDPTAAAQLLVNGEATLSQLKARGVTPEFIQQTLNEAQRISGGVYNAQKAEADFKVAESPENVRFFGSAKSLTDPGGTLDQLAQAAKSIPQNQMPVLNSIEDWEKAATGSGPIAKYAAVALGVADDYAKVMGGGQGSDTSRSQALQLIGAKQSPEQRAASLQGIRGAVSSQTNSRIGNNSVMKRMYGSDNQQAPASGLIYARDPQGKLHSAKAGTALPAGWTQEKAPQ